MFTELVISDDLLVIERTMVDGIFSELLGKDPGSVI